MLNYALAIFISITSYVPSDEKAHHIFDSKIETTKTYFAESKIEEAKQQAQEAHQFAIDHNYDWGEAKALFIMAYFADQDEEYEKALPYYLESIILYDKIGTEAAYSNKCNVLINLGNIMLYNSKYKNAIKYYDQGIEIAGEYNFKNSLNILLTNKLIALGKAKMFEKAYDTYLLKEQQLSSQDIVEKLINYNELGIIYKEQKNYQDARIQYQKIVDLESNSPTSEFTGLALANLANTFFIEGRNTEALKIYSQALELVEKDQNETSEAFLIKHSIANVYFHESMYAKAFHYAQKAELLFSSVSKNKENIEIFSLLSDIHFEMGNIETGKKYAKIHAAKLTELIDRQQKITEIGNQYKMDYITTSYFSEKEKRRNTITFIWVIVTMILSFLAFRLYQLYKKIMVGRLLRKEMASVKFNLDDDL